MTVSATLLGTLLHGVAASRPAANAVAGGTIYSATDTGTITQSDGSSWATFATISSGLADPMNTRGDIIIRNASNVTARLPIGSSGKVLSSDGTDVSWQTPSASAVVAGQIIGQKQYTPGSDSTVHNTSSTSSVDVDATNCVVTFTVPASGNVIVAIDSWSDQNTGGIGYWQVRQSTTVLCEWRMGDISASSNRTHVEALITGLTPGASLTWKMGHRVSSGSQDVYAGPLTGTYGPFLMYVMAAL